MYILPNSSQVGKSKRRSSRSPNRISVASFCDWVIMTSSLNKYLGTGKATVLIGWELSYKNHPWWINWGLTFPGGSVGKKNPPAKCRKCKRLWFNPRVRRRKWQPTPVFSPGKSHGQRSMAGYSPWGLKSWTQLATRPPPLPGNGPRPTVWIIRSESRANIYLFCSSPSIENYRPNGGFTPRISGQRQDSSSNGGCSLDPGRAFLVKARPIQVARSVETRHQVLG